MYTGINHDTFITKYNVTRVLILMFIPYLQRTLLVCLSGEWLFSLKQQQVYYVTYMPRLQSSPSECGVLAAETAYV